MKSRNIRFLIVLASLALIGISIAQVYWVRQAFRQEVDHFHMEVNAALNDVAEELYDYVGVTKPAFSPIRQLTGNYYVVRIDGPIDANLLDQLLRQGFSKRNIRADFEYGIYDCETEGMVFDKFVAGSDLNLTKQLEGLPIWDETNYYFGVYFPGRQRYILGQMSIWGFTSLVMITVILFFGYGLFVIMKQKRLSEIQKDFINNMTHEFRTPISTIEVASTVLQNPEIINEPERLQNYASIINKENMRLKNQVDRVLQLASIENSDLNLELEPVEFHVIIRDAVAHFETDESINKITVELEADNDLVVGDQLHLTNVIYNLLDNAKKYSKETEINIITSNLKGLLQIQIKDNGVGIAPNELSHVFRKFYRVNTGNRHDVKGFGIGLSYVKAVLDAHNGLIEVESQPNEGSTFIIRLNNEG